MFKQKAKGKGFVDDTGIEDDDDAANLKLTLRLQDAPTTPKTPKRGRNPRRTPGTIELPPSKDSVTLTVALTHVAKDPEVLKLTTIEKIEYAQNIMLTLFS